jgi:hypothetical protein
MGRELSGRAKLAELSNEIKTADHLVKNNDARGRGKGRRPVILPAMRRKAAPNRFLKSFA